MSLEAKIEALTAAVEANTEAVLAAAGGAAKAPAKSGTVAKKTTAAKKTTKKAPTADDLAEQFGSYMKTGSKDARDEAKANVKAIIGHFDVDRITNLDEENYAEALELLAKFKAGENPLDDDEEEGDDDLM